MSTPQTTGLRPSSRGGRQGPSVLRRSPEPPPPPASFSAGRPLPPGVRPPTPQSPREESTLLPFLASPPSQASLAISPSIRQGQRMLCHPTYFSRSCETTVCLENTLSNLGKGACGSDDVAVFGPGPGPSNSSSGHRLACLRDGRCAASPVSPGLCHQAYWPHCGPRISPGGTCAFPGPPDPLISAEYELSAGLDIGHRVLSLPCCQEGEPRVTWG